MKALKPHCRHWVSKQFSGFTSSGKRMHRWGKLDSEACPRCGQVEDSVNIIKCQEVQAKTQWTVAIETRKEWLQENDTPPGIIAAVCTRLLEWQDGLSRPIEKVLRHKMPLGGMLFSKAAHYKVGLMSNINISSGKAVKGPAKGG
jgi:hypothetical protein